MKREDPLSSPPNKGDLLSPALLEDEKILPLPLAGSERFPNNDFDEATPNMLELAENGAGLLGWAPS